MKSPIYIHYTHSSNLGICYFTKPSLTRCQPVVGRMNPCNFQLEVKIIDALFMRNNYFGPIHTIFCFFHDSKAWEASHWVLGPPTMFISPNVEKGKKSMVSLCYGDMLTATIG